LPSQVKAKVGEVEIDISGKNSPIIIKDIHAKLKDT